VIKLPKPEGEERPEGEEKEEAGEIQRGIACLLNLIARFSIKWHSKRPPHRIVRGPFVTLDVRK